MKILCGVRACPDFMKVVPIIGQRKSRGIDYVLMLIGQHYDEKMSQFFFDDLGIPKPSRAKQTGDVLFVNWAVIA